MSFRSYTSYSVPCQEPFVRLSYGQFEMRFTSTLLPFSLDKAKTDFLAVGFILLVYIFNEGF